MYQCSKYNERLNVTGKKIKELRMKNKLSLSDLSTKLALIGIDISKPPQIRNRQSYFKRL